ncbi:MAG: ABC transporter ATP-binding protein [Oscillospiraceae bacterium]|nr:ABC transporter ATP-binding protein [Oscillospiraceae bacterium]
MKAVEAVKLTKKYKTKTAVDGIDFHVEKGELFALLGVNGAGKTTTIRMLTCLSKPTSGSAEVCGHNTLTESEDVKRIIGISPQDTAIAENLTIKENLQLVCRIYGFDKDKTTAKINEMTDIFGLSEVLNDRAKTLSGGWKRKLSIAMALISEPEVLFLDEPTLGLDVLARRELWRAIEALKGKITIILTTHYMEEAESLSDRIAIMLGGRIAAMGTLSEIEQIAGEEGLEASFVKIADMVGKGEL